ncbi:MAG: NAD+ synthase [Bacteroidota bacterium]|nr:MAG: NAD+ synthase [Bacteroidota bacterium]
MKITLAQINYIIGDFTGNTQKILQTVQLARQEKSDLVVFSELSVCGYPPLDMLEHRYFIEKTEEAVELIAQESQTIGIIIGAPVVNHSQNGKNLFNAALYCYQGKVQQTIKKTLLPTYDVFDEYRYFEPNNSFEIIRHQGKKIALTICEDLWYEQPILTDFGKEKLYSLNPLDKLMELKPDFIINIAASPFAYNHDQVKREILMNNAKKYQLPIFYVNQVGAQTEIIFDGGSRVLTKNGAIYDRMPFFEESLRSYQLEDILENQSGSENFPIAERIEKIHNALVLGVRDYFKKSGLKKAILGLSGGIDSAVTLVIAAKALGKENVSALLLPSKYSSDHSVSDAIALAKNLGIQYSQLGIQPLTDCYESLLTPVFRGLPADITEENLQARIRGTLLMALSNKFGSILLNTSNKSEAAVGYGTLYGDMNGGISVLGDVYKTDVYALAHFMNRKEEIIPVNTILKPPSAELRPDQKDSDSLPEYDVLDRILFHYIELRLSGKEIIQLGFEKEVVQKTIRLINFNEYKRFQTPPILRVSSKAFGLGRRMPLVARHEE